MDQPSLQDLVLYSAIGGPAVPAVTMALGAVPAGLAHLEALATERGVAAVPVDVARAKPHDLEALRFAAQHATPGTLAFLLHGFDRVRAEARLAIQRLVLALAATQPVACVAQTAPTWVLAESPAAGPLLEDLPVVSPAVLEAMAQLWGDGAAPTGSSPRVAPPRAAG